MRSDIDPENNQPLCTVTYVAKAEAGRRDEKPPLCAAPEQYSSPASIVYLAPPLRLSSSTVVSSPRGDPLLLGWPELLLPLSSTPTARKLRPGPPLLSHVVPTPETPDCDCVPGCSLRCRRAPPLSRAIPSLRHQLLLTLLLSTLSCGGPLACVETCSEKITHPKRQEFVTLCGAVVSAVGPYCQISMVNPQVTRSKRVKAKSSL